jgi:hypothetical protein
MFIERASKLMINSDQDMEATSAARARSHPWNCDVLDFDRDITVLSSQKPDGKWRFVCPAHRRPSANSNVPLSVLSDYTRCGFQHVLDMD